MTDQTADGGAAQATDPNNAGGANSTGVINLSDVKPTGGGGGGGGSPSSVVPYALEKTRAQIAYFLLWILAAVVVVQFVGGAYYSVDCWLFQTSCANAQQASGIFSNATGSVFTAIVGLVGSVVGFYFGSQKT